MGLTFQAMLTTQRTGLPTIAVMSEAAARVNAATDQFIQGIRKSKIH